MNTIRIQLSDGDRDCAVGAQDLQMWSTALVDQILFEAAKNASQQGAKKEASAVISFRVTVDNEDGSLQIKV
jgi:hypothetical protein